MVAYVVTVSSLQKFCSLSYKSIFYHSYCYFLEISKDKLSFILFPPNYHYLIISIDISYHYLHPSLIEISHQKLVNADYTTGDILKKRKNRADVI